MHVTWINWILHVLIPTISLAATVMPSVGGGDGGAAGAIINSDPDGGEPTESTDGTESTEGEPTEGTEEETTEGGSAAGTQKTEQVDWRTVPAEVKAHVQELAKSNPKLANQLQNAIYTSNNFLKEVPGGLKEIRAMKTEIESLGGMEEIKTLSATHKALVDEQEDLDSRARAGDPEILNNLVEIAGKDGFAKLMPHTLSRWMDADPQGYSHEMSKIMVNAMREGGLVSDLNMAFRMLKLGTPEAIKEAVECLNRSAEWANGINTIATKVPDRPKVDPNIAAEQQKLSEREAKVFNTEFASQFGSWRSNEISKEISQASSGRTLNEYQMNTLTQRIINDMKDILTTDSDYMKNLERLYNARNMADLQKFARARTLKLLPEVTKKAYRSLFSNPGAKKVVAKPGTTTPVTKPGTVTTPVAGWTKVEASKAPSPDDIDSKKTTFEMKFRKQAILKNGKKVYWGAHVPK